jgi:UDP-N-acetylmuramate dehydrogenase
MSNLIARLEGLPGLALDPGEPLAPHSTFRIGGAAEVLVEVADEGALQQLLMIVEDLGAPFFLLGLGSNVLFPDEGLEGVVAHLGGSFTEVEIAGERVRAGAGVSLAGLARRLARAGLTGMETLAGFPSTVGGAVYMNAGSYGVEIKDILVEATVVEPGGEMRTLTCEQLEPAYRRTALQGSGALVTRAVFQLQPGDAGEALAKIDQLNRRRRQSLPSGDPNVGSIFRNPADDSAGRLIDACGLKGSRRGGAQISPKHGNVIVNTGGARAVEVLELMTAARNAVGERFGVWLEPEVVLTGALRTRWRQACEEAADL